MYVYNSLNDISFAGSLCYVVEKDPFYLFYENGDFIDAGLSCTKIEFLARLRKCTYDGSIASEKDISRMKIKTGNIIVIAPDGSLYFSLSKKYKNKLFKFEKRNEFKEFIVPVSESFVKYLHTQDFIDIKSIDDLNALCDSFRINRKAGSFNVRYTRPSLCTDGYFIDDDFTEVDISELIF